MPTAFLGPLKLGERLGTPRRRARSPRWIPRGSRRCSASARRSIASRVRWRGASRISAQFVDRALRRGRGRRLDARRGLRGSPPPDRGAPRLRRDEDQGARLGAAPSGSASRSPQGLVPDHPTLGDVDSREALDDVSGAEAGVQGVAPGRLASGGDRRSTQTAIELTTLTGTAASRRRRVARLDRGVPRRGASARSTSRCTTSASRPTRAGSCSRPSSPRSSVASRVRLLYNVAHPGPIPVPPPPETAPVAIEALPVETLPVPGIPDLMHHKFVVRDELDVWTGSTNWTDDSWSRQENIIVRVLGARAARACVPARVRRTLVEAGRRGLRARAAAAREGRSRRGEAVVHPGARRGALPPHREARRQGTRADPDRLAGPHVGPDPRHARRGGERGAVPTSPGSWTTRRSTRSSTSGRRTA